MYIRFRTSAYKYRSGGTYEVLPGIVSGEVLSSYCEGLRNFWCTPTVGWLSDRISDGHGRPKREKIGSAATAVLVPVGHSVILLCLRHTNAI